LHFQKQVEHLGEPQHEVRAMAQATANVTAIPTARREAAPARPQRQHRPSKAAILRRHAPAAGLGLVILVLLYLSLNHLARGIQVVTLCEHWEGIAMAIGLDLLIVGLEVAMVVTAGTKGRAAGRAVRQPGFAPAFAWSAGLNGFAFCANQDAMTWKAVAAALGVSIPVLIYLATRSWAALTIESRRAAA
jgi:hypothetical protein